MGLASAPIPVRNGAGLTGHAVLSTDPLDVPRAAPAGADSSSTRAYADTKLRTHRTRRPLLQQPGRFSTQRLISSIRTQPYASDP
jgi:hypothetical protein